MGVPQTDAGLAEKNYPKSLKPRFLDHRSKDSNFLCPERGLRTCICEMSLSDPVKGAAKIGKPPPPMSPFIQGATPPPLGALPLGE